MDMGEAIVACYQKFFQFTGRARRADFWYFYLLGVIVNIVLDILERFVFGDGLIVGLLLWWSFSATEFR
jgi:uncharacterized membrane protein YhaH (DUF805 family)